jgi:HK97 gp10 family phage protein
MPKAITVEVTGLRELQQKLERELPEKARKVTRDALKAGAQPIYEAMRQEAPVGRWAQLRSGFNVKFKFFENGKAGAVFIGPDAKMKHEQEPGRKRAPLSMATVARFVEFGFTERDGTKQAGNPFMTRAFEQQKETALNRIVEKLKELLQ